MLFDSSGSRSSFAALQASNLNINAVFDGDDFLNPNTIGGRATGVSKDITPIGSSSIKRLRRLTKLDIPDLFKNPKADTILGDVTNFTNSVKPVGRKKNIKGVPGFPYGKNPSALDILFTTNGFSGEVFPPSMNPSIAPYTDPAVILGNIGESPTVIPSQQFVPLTGVPLNAWGSPVMNPLTSSWANPWGSQGAVLSAPPVVFQTNNFWMMPQMNVSLGAFAAFQGNTTQESTGHVQPSAYDGMPSMYSRYSKQPAFLGFQATM